MVTTTLYTLMIGMALSALSTLFLRHTTMSITSTQGVIMKSLKKGIGLISNLKPTIRSHRGSRIQTILLI